VSNPTNKVMLGNESVRQYIASHLKTAMPDIIDVARSQWSLEDYELPYPVRYDSYDPLTANDYPVIGSLISRTSNWAKIDINEYAEDVYEADYAVRIFCWVRTPELPDGTWKTPEYDSALALRDSMMSLLRSVILTTPSLGSNGALRVEEGSLSEDYLDAMKSSDQSGRWMSGGIISVTISQQEANYVLPIAQANTVLVDGHHLDEGVAP
jgi:hypothetical protein